MTDGERLLDLLWQRYADDVPYARVFVGLAGSLVTDHVAFRTLRRPGGGIAAIAPVFERLGWRAAGQYEFPDQHLTAIHLSHPSGLPRVFLSELDPEPLAPAARRILDRLPPDQPAPRHVEQLALWFEQPFGTSSFDDSGAALLLAEEDLLTLEESSQYAAWLAAFGRKVNHFTAAVLDVETWHARLAAAGVPMKPTIEGARGSLLRQAATRAFPLGVLVRGAKVRAWPYAYFELAERKPGFDGFLAPQARELFEMTRR